MSFKPESEGHALAMGKYWIDRDPLYILKTLRAQIGYCNGKWIIELSDVGLKRIDDCISFNEGQQN